MARVTYVQPDGSSRTCTNFEGMAVMHLAVGNLVDGIDALCGGVRQCGTCHVYVDDAWAARAKMKRRCSKHWRTRSKSGRRAG